ncbi:MAG: hypothetical protein J7L95_02080 [Prolixibacteraceae bacterium]|nr:hypothetical protein [Prolixibacteraceae bacterium]
MKKNITYFALLLLVTAILTNCKKTEIPDPFPSAEVEGCYIINYGSFGKGGASISKYDYNTDEMTNFYYQAQNNGNEILSNIQYGYQFNDSIFLLGNSTDQLVTVNPLFEQSMNGVTEKIEKPRFCVADGNYLYISCWGANPDWSEMPDTYIAKYNIATRTVDEKIALPGGPEGLEIANGKLYAALNYKDSVAVINLTSKQVSYIATPAVTSYFVKDKSKNLYVTLLSTYSHFSNQTGLGYINTTTGKLDATYPLANVSTSYGSMIQANADFSKIYLVTSAYDANWNLTGAVSEFNVAGKSFGDSSLISDIQGISGMTVNPKDGKIYVFTAQNVTGAGLMKIYSAVGDFVKEFEVGASPGCAVFID